MRRPALAVLLLCAMGAADGCGGGGGSSAAPKPTPTPTPGSSTCTAYAVSADAHRLAPRGIAFGVAPHRLYVTYRPDVTSGTARRIDAAVRATRSTDFGTDGSGVAHRVVTLPSDSDDAAAAAALRASAGVVDVQPIHLRYPSGDASANDQYLNTADQWYLYRTSVDSGAWAITHGAPSTVSVAVVDTGADETNTADFAFDVRESVINGVRSTGAGTVQDTNGHGTNVAGLAAAISNNSYGFAGVGYSTHVQVYRVFPPATATTDCQQADTGDEATAIRDAVANGASVINLSLGGPQSGGFDPAERDAVAFAIANNVTVVAAGGNEYPGSDGNVPDYPAAYPGVIAVGASAVQNAVANAYSSITTETVASYSNSGVTLVAPGGDANGTTDADALHWIEGYSTTTAAFAPDRCSNSGGVCRVFFNGTSQATPIVAGTVALMEAYHGGRRSLTPAQVLSMLTSTADQLPGIATARQGAGRLNAAKAVAAAHP